MAIGIENPEVFPDSVFTASSEYADHGARHSRLNDAAYWAVASGGVNNDWIQVDLGEIRSLVGIATQGSQCVSDSAWWEWVETYTIQYSIDGANYESIPGTFSGNTQCGEEPVRNEFSLINARYVKIWPTQVHEWASMRFELFEGITFPFIAHRIQH